MVFHTTTFCASSGIFLRVSKASSTFPLVHSFVNLPDNSYGLRSGFPESSPNAFRRDACFGIPAFVGLGGRGRDGEAEAIDGELCTVDSERTWMSGVETWRVTAMKGGRAFLIIGRWRDEKEKEG